MYQISKQFSFSASHHLAHLPAKHPCARLHGHNYRVEIVLRADVLDVTGFVVDYGELSVIKKYIDDTLDHRHLNDVFTFNPTAENIAKNIYQECKKHWPKFIHAVRVSETEKTWAEYSE